MTDARAIIAEWMGADSDDEEIDALLGDFADAGLAIVPRNASKAMALAALSPDTDPQTAIALDMIRQRQATWVAMVDAACPEHKRPTLEDLRVENGAWEIYISVQRRAATRSERLVRDDRDGAMGAATIVLSRFFGDLEGSAEGPRPRETPINQGEKS